VGGGVFGVMSRQGERARLGGIGACLKEEGSDPVRTAGGKEGGSEGFLFRRQEEKRILNLPTTGKKKFPSGGKSGGNGGGLACRPFTSLLGNAQN